MGQFKTEYYPSRWLPALWVFSALLWAAFGVRCALSPGWEKALGLLALPLVPVHLWAAWRYWRVPIITVESDQLENRHAVSSHRQVFSLTGFGRLKWSTRSFLCFEHATQDTVTLDVRWLPKDRRADLLRRLGAERAL